VSCPRVFSSASWASSVASWVTAGTQGIPQAKGHVVALENFDDVVEVGIEGVLLVVVQHPPGQNAAPARDNAGDAIAHQGQMLNQNPGVDGHVVHPLLGVLLDDVQKVVRRQAFDIAVDALQRLVHRHRTNGDGEF
jgi:hypothetical protein